MSRLRPVLNRICDWVAPPTGVFRYTHNGHTFAFRYSDAATFSKLDGCLEHGEIAHERIPIDYFDIGQVFDGIVDVGAHFGIYTVVLAVINADRPVIAFEPNDRNRQVLKTNLSTNGLDKDRVSVRSAVVAEREGPVQFYEDPSGWTVSHTINPAKRHAGFQPTNRQAVRLSDVIDEAGFTRPWVKIDAEGAEIGILRDVLKNGIELAGYVELHPDREGVSVKGMEALFREHGYQWRSVKRRYAETNPGYLFGQGVV